MINTQLGRRNLPPQQRIAVVKKFENKIKQQAKEKQSDAGKEYGNGKNSSSPNGEKLNVHTDKELAKMAGVGAGTVARFNQVMKSDNEELKKEVLSGAPLMKQTFKLGHNCTLKIEYWRLLC